MEVKMKDNEGKMEDRGEKMENNPYKTLKK
jgi:hypothetical protein